MAFVVVYDACVLFPIRLCDLLLRVAESGLVQAKWTDQILDECFDSIKAKRPGLDPVRLDARRRAMNMAIDDCLVTDYEALVPALELPDPDDRHVLAAAIKCGAQVIVTNNLKDFPATLTGLYNVEALSADEFVSDLIGLDESTMRTIVGEQAAALKSPPHTVAELLDGLEHVGLVQAVQALRASLGREPGDWNRPPNKFLHADGLQGALRAARLAAHR